MSARGLRAATTRPASGPGEEPPAASLLSVPIFRAAARQQGTRAPAPPAADAPAPEALTFAAAPDAGVDGGGPGPRPVPPRPTRTAVDALPGYRTLLDYWRTLARQGRAPVAQLDAALIAARWPYAMLIRVPRDGLVDITQVFAPEPAAVSAGESAGGRAQHPFARDQASQISSWVLDIARQAAGSRQPSRQRETFHQTGRQDDQPRRISAELLPCQADGDSAAYLLLYLRDG